MDESAFIQNADVGVLVYGRNNVDWRKKMSAYSANTCPASSNTTLYYTQHKCTTIHVCILLCKQATMGNTLLGMHLHVCCSKRKNERKDENGADAHPIKTAYYLHKAEQHRLFAWCIRIFHVSYRLFLFFIRNVPELSWACNTGRITSNNPKKKWNKSILSENLHSISVSMTSFSIRYDMCNQEAATIFYNTLKIFPQNQLYMSVVSRNSFHHLKHYSFWKTLL